MKKTHPKPSARVTVRDIAEASKFTIGTVSTVLNKHHVERRIPLETVEIIRATAARLGYLPDIGARRLRSGTGLKHNIVIAFVTSFEAPLGVVNQFVSALRKAAAGAGGPQGRTFSLMIEMFAAGRLRESPGLLTGDHFNAALIANTTPEDDLFLGRTHLPYPVVLVNRSVPRYASVVEEPMAGARSAGVLVRTKRSGLAVLYGRPLTQTTHARVDSFMAASVQLLGRPAQVIVADSLSESGAYEAMARFFAAGGRCDGLYAVTDSLALGAYHAIKRQKLIIPDDIAVLGVGDYENSPYFDPPLSSVGVLRQQVGWQASQLLLRMLGEPGSLEPERFETPVEIVLRESTGHG
ncbi:MAG: LacI family transcriptional regulator [Opitutus sp.]|nr:LacI family transcriptional regulator [Opitutus sp.]